MKHTFLALALILILSESVTVLARKTTATVDHVAKIGKALEALKKERARQIEDRKLIGRIQSSIDSVPVSIRTGKKSKETVRSKKASQNPFKRLIRNSGGLIV